MSRIVLTDLLLREALRIAISSLTGGRVDQPIESVAMMHDDNTEISIARVSLTYGEVEAVDVEYTEVRSLPAPFTLIQGGRVD